jgi:hypothetical protein
MANLTPTASFDSVIQLEINTVALAGEGGIMNAQAQALLNRTAYLKGVLDGFTEALNLKLDASAYNEYNKGVYSSLFQLNTAHPTALAGSYALVDTGVGNEADFYWFDLDDGWVTNGGMSLANTDALVEGSTNLYFTSARAISAVTATINAAVAASLEPTINTQTVTAYTVGTVSADNDGKTILRMDNASANTATITTAQTKPISIRQAGTGITTIEAGAGVTLNGSLVFAAQHQTKTIYRVSSGIYDVVG